METKSCKEKYARLLKKYQMELVKVKLLENINADLHKDLKLWKTGKKRAEG